MRWDPDGEPPFEFGNVRIVKATENGLQIGGDAVENITGETTKWIPRTAVHEDGEIKLGAEVGDEGELFVRRWLAEKEGWSA